VYKLGSDAEWRIVALNYVELPQSGQAYKQGACSATILLGLRRQRHFDRSKHRHKQTRGCTGYDFRSTHLCTILLDRAVLQSVERQLFLSTSLAMPKCFNCLFDPSSHFLKRESTPTNDCHRNSIPEIIHQ